MSPHAPEPCGQAPTGRQWFPLPCRAPERALGRRQAGRAGAGRVPRRRARAPQAAAVGAGAGRLQPGHDDGAACRACAARRARRDRRLFRHLRAAGAAEPEAVAGEIKAQPPVLLVHGDQDDSSRCRRCSWRATALAKAQMSCEWHLSFGVGARHRRRGPAPCRAIRRPGPHRAHAGVLIRGLSACARARYPAARQPGKRTPMNASSSSCHQPVHVQHGEIDHLRRWLHRVASARSPRPVAGARSRSSPTRAWSRPASSNPPWPRFKRPASRSRSSTPSWPIRPSRSSWRPSRPRRAVGANGVDRPRRRLVAWTWPSWWRCWRPAARTSPTSTASASPRARACRWSSCRPRPARARR